MGSLSPWHLLILALIVLVIFGGRGKLSSIMGDAAKGVKAFKDGLKDDDTTEKREEKGEILPRTDKEKEDLRS